MAAKKNASGRSWKNERASVNHRGGSKTKSNKYRPGSDRSKVKGHYVNISARK